MMMQDDSSDTDTSSSEYESSEDGEEAPSSTSSLLVKSDLFVTGEFQHSILRTRNTGGLQWTATACLQPGTQP